MFCVGAVVRTFVKFRVEVLKGGEEGGGVHGGCMPFECSSSCLFSLSFRSCGNSLQLKVMEVSLLLCFRKQHITWGGACPFIMGQLFTLASIIGIQFDAVIGWFVVHRP